MAGCGSRNTDNAGINQNASTVVEDSQIEETADTEDNTADQESETNIQDPVSRGEELHTNVLVVYFSCTNTTKGVAETIAAVTGGDLFEIEAAVPYTSDDRNYNDSESRCTVEQNDDTIRPEIANTVSNMEDYEYILIGFPIWWGEEPRIIDTFIESYDFSGKTVTSFCTSASSGIGGANSRMKSLISDSAKWIDGNRWESGVSESDITTWLNEVDADILD